MHKTLDQTEAIEHLTSEVTGLYSEIGKLLHKVGALELKSTTNVRKYTTTIVGDNAVIVHNLGTETYSVSVYSKTSQKEERPLGTHRYHSNVVRIIMPKSDTYEVVIMG